MKPPERLWLLLFSPLKSIAEVKSYMLRDYFIKTFAKWGVPKWIKADNGRPVGDPGRNTIPVLALWLIGMGVEVYYNRPRTPQQNSKVERCQGTMAIWTEPSECKDHIELQDRLLKEAHFYNNVFQDRRQKGTTRKQRFPGLAFTGRKFDQNDFRLDRVLIYLRKMHWKRKIATMGQLSHFGQRFSVGTKYAGETVVVSLCKKENLWEVRTRKGDLIKQQPTGLSAQSIIEMDQREND